MKADLYVQGHFWATIDVPGDSLLALLAQGMISRAERLAHQLKSDLNALEGVNCSISLRLKSPVAFSPPDTSQDPDAVAP